METKITNYFDDIIRQAKENFEQVTHNIDITPNRANLKINAIYGAYRIFVTEVLSDEYRRYNYYILKINFVIAGFDNAPDIRAIKLKYSKMPSNDKDKFVPHLHLENKTILELTDEIQFTNFINWIKINIKNRDQKSF